VHSETTSKRITTAIAVAVVLFVAAVPAAMACCGMTSAHTTSMHALMSCCDETCTLTRSAPNADREVTLTTPLPIVAVVARATMAPVVANDREIIETRPLETSPPLLLLDRQLRI